MLSFILAMKYAGAQSLSFGINAGATLASYKIKYSSVSITSKSKVGFAAGIISNVSIGKSFSFQPALNFLQKGGALKESGYSDKSTLNYLELPLDVVFNTNSTKGKFFAGLGPCLSFGLTGKEKYEDDGGHVEKTDIKFGSGNEDDLKPFELSGNILAGYQFKGGFFIAVNYNTGLSNIIIDNGEIDSKYHNRYFGLKIGFMFPGRKK